MTIASHRFDARIRLIGINPYVRVPAAIVQALLRAAGKIAGPLPVQGTLQGAAFSANVVRYSGLWRLYLNLTMRRAAKAEVGDDVAVELRFDPTPRHLPVPRTFALALSSDAHAKAAFARLPPSRQKEILRYLGQLKRADTLARNIGKTLRFLHGEPVQGLVALTRVRRPPK
jgi:hypothetical protein